jgi:peptide/nickel transport system ATP-binding protein
MIKTSVSRSEHSPDPAPAEGAPLLEARGLTQHFRVGGLFSHRTLHAVDDVNLVIYPREIVALVGESGSGKSTIARLLAGIYKPTGGEIIYRGRPLAMQRGQLRSYRKHVQMVFQDPYSSLNPVFRASHGIFRSLKLHRPDLNYRQRTQEAEKIVQQVGLNPPEEFLRKYPYELSGGQRQRYGFAQALACGPDLILADEPVSMLDVSIRTGVLNLMTDLCRRQGVSFLYITHDIASARYVADRLLVMYAGKVVEQGPTEDVLQYPKHPYTQLLLSAVPDPHVDVEESLDVDLTEPPRVIDPGAGCRFRWRCPYRQEICDRVTPPLRELRPDHLAACHVAQSEMPERIAT